MFTPAANRKEEKEEAAKNWKKYCFTIKKNRLWKIICKTSFIQRL